MVKLSIVIPIYNVHDYISRCVDSCLYQPGVSTEDYEIILINDGSTDEGFKRIQKYKSFSNVSVYTQDNCGLSATRNRGIGLAKGEYIWFVDSDDWIAENSIRVILDTIEDGVDVVALSYENVYDDRSNTIKMQKPAKNGVQLLVDQCPHPAQFYVCNKIFLNSIELRFSEELVHEDIEFTTCLLYQAQHVAVIQHVMYYFYQRNNSISRGVKNPKRAFDTLAIAMQLYEFARAKVLPEDCSIFADGIATALNIGLSMLEALDDIQLYEYKRLLSQTKCISDMIVKSKSRKYKIEGYLLKWLPSHCFVNLYKIYKL